MFYTKIKDDLIYAFFYRQDDFGSVYRQGFSCMPAANLIDQLAQRHSVWNLRYALAAAAEAKEKGPVALRNALWRRLNGLGMVRPYAVSGLSTEGHLDGEPLLNLIAAAISKKAPLNNQPARQLGSKTRGVHKNYCHRGKQYRNRRLSQCVDEDEPAMRVKDRCRYFFNPWGSNYRDLQRSWKKHRKTQHK